jgi:hypothetical protein
MAQTFVAGSFHALAGGPGINHPDGQHIVPLDQENAGVGPVIPVAAITGLSEFTFNFFNEGGTNNLKPGRPTTQTVSFAAPGGAGGFVCLRTIIGAFVTDGGTHLTERPLGEIMVTVFFSGPGKLSCTIELSDSNSDDPVKVIVQGLIVFFR